MKITFILPFASLSGGVRVIATYALHLKQLGHDVTVISQPKKKKRRKGWRKVLIPLDRIRSSGQQGHKTPLLDFLGDKHVVLDRARPVTADDVPDADVIVASWWETAEWVAKLPSEKGKPFYLLQEYEIFDKQPADRVAATYALPLKKIAVSNYIAATIKEKHGQNVDIVVPNAIDTKQFDAPPRSKNPCLTVGFLYTLSKRKQVALAIDAVTKAKELLPDLQVIAFGAVAPSAAAALPSWISYHQNPPQDLIPKLYAQCDIWLFTSKHEGFGLPLLEAMACRTPVLATPAGAAPDLIDGSNGVLLASDAERFVEQIIHFASLPPEHWQSYSDSAYKTAHSYTYLDATKALLDVLTDRPSA